MKRASVIGMLAALIIGGVTCMSFADVFFYGGGGTWGCKPTDYNRSLQSEADEWVDTWGGEVTGVDKFDGASRWVGGVGYETPSYGSVRLEYVVDRGYAGWQWRDLGWDEQLEIKDKTVWTGFWLWWEYWWACERFRFKPYVALGGGSCGASRERTVPVENLTGGWDWYEWDLNAEREIGYGLLVGSEFLLIPKVYGFAEIGWQQLKFTTWTIGTHDYPSFEGHELDEEFDASGWFGRIGVRCRPW
ncbi:hypothetical protein E3J48_01355 [Candidatus Aerophobetes bacterium]|uniref:Uncharacterized protein n=1 Tax=Aerophobetes bacterium TaxID=2030807 RepID=A0A523WB80_UNCAE|nr:MAG: hypothetical protein E3J48_01355 [Candidatus Aerophobetes bacterium]